MIDFLMFNGLQPARGLITAGDIAGRRLKLRTLGTRERIIMCHTVSGH